MNRAGFPGGSFEGPDLFDHTIQAPDQSLSTARASITVMPPGEDLLVGCLVGYLYEAGPGRIPAPEGLNLWTDRILDGIGTKAELARAFLVSDKFMRRTGGPVETISDRNLVEQLFLNVLRRPGADAGISTYVDNLGSGVTTRKTLLVTFAESPENLLGSPTIAEIVELPGGTFDFA